VALRVDWRYPIKGFDRLDLDMKLKKRMNCLPDTAGRAHLRRSIP